MLTPEQLKGKIRNFAKEKRLLSQEILQMYLFERVLDRLSKSKYKNNFILKGGLLISSMVGVSERTTMDIDTTVKGIAMNKESIEYIVKEILAIDVGDGIEFEYEKIEDIRKDDDYNSFRVLFNAKYGKINNPMKIDITTGDEITPSAIKYQYSTIFNEGTIKINAYNLETIIAEKYETIIRRNIVNTRARDFYDLYVLYKTYEDKIDKSVLKRAIEKTSENRQSLNVIEKRKSIVSEIAEDTIIKNLWSAYQNEYSYAKEIEFDDIVDVLKKIGTILDSDFPKE